MIDGGLNVWTYQPAIGGNALGDVAIVYTQSDATTCPTIMATARSAQTGTFSSPVLIKTSVTYATKDPSAIRDPHPPERAGRPEGPSWKGL